MGGVETLIAVLGALSPSSEGASLAAEALVLLSAAGKHKCPIIVR